MNLFFKKNKDLNFPKEILIDNKEFKIEVNLIDKKSSSVNIKDNILNFRISKKMPNSKIEEHFNELLKKITIKIKKNPNLIENKIDFKKILERNYFFFNNEKYELKYSKNKRFKLIEEKNIIQIPILKDYSLIQKGIIKLLILKYTPRIKDYLFELNKETYGFKINGFHLNDVKTKWGHCTQDNRIMLNLKLLNAPREVLNYVIFHELSHIKFKNHSKEFWNEVEKFCPKYKNMRKYLKENPPEIFQLN